MISQKTIPASQKEVSKAQLFLTPDYLFKDHKNVDSETHTACDQSSTICKSQKLALALSVKDKVDKEDVLYIHNGILLGYK